MSPTLINIDLLKENPDNPRTITLKKCLICQCEFKTKPSHFKRRQTCSMACRAKLLTLNQSGTNHPLFKNGLSVRQTYACKACQKEFTSEKGYTGRAPQFCCSKCYGVYIGSGEPRSELDILRKSKEYYHWRKQVYDRDRHTCVLCGCNKSGSLEADHIKPFAYYPDLRFDVSNGRTLCKDCHRKTPTYGSRKKGSNPTN